VSFHLSQDTMVYDFENDVAGIVCQALIGDVEVGAGARLPVERAVDL